jgi:hypothetical protein
VGGHGEALSDRDEAQAVPADVVAALRAAEAARPTWSSAIWMVALLLVLGLSFDDDRTGWLRSAALVAAIVLHDLCAIVVMHIVGQERHEGLTVGRVLDVWRVHEHEVSPAKRALSWIGGALAGTWLAGAGLVIVVIVAAVTGAGPISTFVGEVLVRLMWFNLFDLVPAGSLSGGRFLRQLLARRPPRWRMTAQWLAVGAIGIVGWAISDYLLVGVAALTMVFSREVAYSRAAWRLVDRAEKDPAMDTARTVPEEWLAPLAEAARAEMPPAKQPVPAALTAQQMLATFHYLHGKRMGTGPFALLLGTWLALLGTSLAAWTFVSSAPAPSTTTAPANDR